MAALCDGALRSERYDAAGRQIIHDSIWAADARVGGERHRVRRALSSNLEVRLEGGHDSQVERNGTVEDLPTTRTKTGLHVDAHLIHVGYPSGVKISNREQEMKDLSVRHHDTQPNRNYTISPKRRSHPNWELVSASATVITDRG